MPTITNESYIGSGIVYVNGRDVGNCSELNFQIESDTKTLPNYRGGGGNAASVERVTAVRLSMKLHEFSNANLALALRGTVASVTAGTVTAEDVIAVLGGLSETANVVDIAQTVTVTNAAAAITYVAGEDYEATPAGIKILADGDITDEQALKVTYTKKAGTALEALVSSGADVRVVFDGLNDSTGRPSVVTVYKWKPAPTSGLGLISDDFAEFDLEGEVIADQSIVAAGKSKFFRRVDAAAA